MHMEILEYNIRGYGKQPFVGILLCKGSKWIVFADNTVDYVIDGISLVNAHYYKECSSVESESTLFEVLSYKYSINKYGKDVLSGIDTYDDNALFHYLCRQKELLEISLERSDYIIVGIIDRVNSKSIVVKTFDTDGKKSDVLRIKTSSIRMLKIRTDYLESLSYIIGTELL